MAGGHATSAGIEFQADVAAWLAAHVLAVTAPQQFGLKADVALTSVFLETAAPVDDILVETSQGGLCFINVKTNVGNTGKLDSSLASVFDQFVRQWLHSKRSVGDRRWDRTLDISRDRMVLAVDTRKSAAFANVSQALLERVGDTGSLTGHGGSFTEPQHRLLGNVRELIRQSWQRHTGDDPDDSEVVALLRIVRVVALDFNGADADYAVQLLRIAVVEGDAAATRAWAILKVCCTHFATSRSGGGRDTLLRKLREERISVRAAPDFRGDIERLRLVTRDTLRSLARLAHLKVPDVDTPVVIDRPCATALSAHAVESSFLLIGEPGAGKSGALHAAAATLQEKGHPVVVLAVDRHPVGTLGALRDDLQLEHGLADVLAQWHSEKPGVLFVDALDASRGGASDTVFLHLLQQVLDIPGWHVVASIRRFDLRFGVACRDLFAGSPVDERFVDNEFLGVRHLLVRKLSNEELSQVWRASPAMCEAYAAADSELRELLRSPFNLFLLSGILQTGDVSERGISTQVQLLDHYWKRRVLGNDDQGYGRERVLASAANAMIDRRTLSVPLSRLGPDADPHLPVLQSEGVLLPLREGRTVAFSHHVLFDYAVARLELELGHAENFAERLTASDEHALMLAPAAIMAFQFLWEEDQSHAAFWRVATSVASAPGVGAFCRMLPARVATPLVRTPEDVGGLLECLSGGAGSDTAAARFLVTHCFGTLVAGVVPKEKIITDPRSPWPAIARQIVETDKAGGTWPWKAVVGHWIEQVADIAAVHTADINSLARQLLARAIREGDDGAVLAGIQGVARTIHASLTASEDVLRRLLLEERVSVHGHRELFWLAREVRHLVGPCPGLVADLYRVVFCAQLPSSDERTPIGDSRIVSLISNKRQDFEGIRRQLSEAFAQFMSAHPGMATAALLDAVDYYIRNEKGRVVEGAFAFSFGESSASFIPDWSGVWWDGQLHGDYDATAVGLLNSFVDGLVALVGSPAAIVDVTSRVAVGPGWACTWEALMRAACRAPESLAVRILPLLTEPAIIGSFDARHIAGEAIAACHPVLVPEQRARIERAILCMDRSSDMGTLLGCLGPESIVTREAIERRRELEAGGALPENQPHIKFFSSWSEEDDASRAKRLGLDESQPEQIAVFEAARALESQEAATGTDVQLREVLAKRWERLVALHSLLLESTSGPEALLCNAWNVLASNLSKVAEACDEPRHLESFPGLLEMVLDVLDKTPWPGQHVDPKAEAEFARLPAWGGIPRVEAASALMAWGRAGGSLTEELRARIRDLSRDASPAVRYQVLARVNFLSDVSSDLMWSLCADAFAREQNEGVLTFFLAACRPILGLRAAWFADRILPLEDRHASKQDASGQFGEIVVDLILRLWLVYEQQSAGERVQTWQRDPIHYHGRILFVLQRLRNTLVQGDVEASTSFDERVRRLAIAFFHEVISIAACRFKASGEVPTLDEAQRKDAEKALRILDSAMMQVYFASGAYDAHAESSEQKVLGDKSRQRFLGELWPILEVLATVAYPSVTHYLLETLEYFIPTAPTRVFRLLVHGLTHGGAHGGYQRESMGADLFVRIVRRYLADHRDVFAADRECRRGLMLALDQFVLVGWQEARRLVYELPEMLR